MQEQNRQEQAAFRAAMEGALRGEADCCCELARCYAAGIGTPVDLEASFRWMKQAAEAGFPAAFYELAVRYYFARGVSRDLEQAKIWAQRAAEQSGDDRAQTLLRQIRDEETSCAPLGAYQYRLGNSYMRKGQIREAMEIWAVGAERGNYGSALALYQAYKQGDHAPKDPVLAFRYLKQVAQLRVDPSCANDLSECYAQGIGTVVNQAAAFYWIKVAAEDGFAPAAYTLAAKYFDGAGTAKDLTQAKLWAEKSVAVKAPNQAHARALLRRIAGGSARAAGQPVVNVTNQAVAAWQKGQFREAARLFRQGAKEGNGFAMHQLSLLYRDGRGVKRDLKRSFEWMMKAAEIGVTIAYADLAEKYRSGQGVEASPEQARLWAERSLEAKAKNMDGARQVLDALDAAEYG